MLLQDASHNNAILVQILVLPARGQWVSGPSSKLVNHTEESSWSKPQQIHIYTRKTVRWRGPTLNTIIYLFTCLTQYLWRKIGSTNLVRTAECTWWTSSCCQPGTRRTPALAPGGKTARQQRPTHSASLNWTGCKGKRSQYSRIQIPFTVIVMA